MKKILVAILFSLFLSGVLVVNAKGIEDAFGSKLKAVAGENGAGYQVNVDPENEISTQVGAFITLALSFLGVLFLILTIYAGFLWMTAQGNESQVKKAKEIMTRSVIGLIIIVSAYSISYLVINKLGSGQLTDKVLKGEE